MRELLARFVEWTQGLGPLGPAAMAAAYVPACVLFLPGSLLTIAAGFAFGLGRGFAAVSVGSTLGASAAFALGRTLARGFVERRVASNPSFQAIDRAVGKEGFKIVLLARLSPVFPFNLLNYALGLTKVSFRDYALASWIGMMPGTALFVYLGSALGSLADWGAGKAPPSAAQRALFWAGLAATAVLAAVLTKLARKALEDANDG